MGAVEKPSSHTASRESGSSGARPGGTSEAPGLIWESLEHALEDLARDDEAPASAPAPTPARPEAIRTLREASVVLEALLHRALPVALPVHGPQALPLLIEQALVSGLGPALGVPAGDLEGSVAVRNRVLAHAPEPSARGDWSRPRGPTRSRTRPPASRPRSNPSTPISPARPCARPPRRLRPS
jgi:hypothetical protein